MPAQAPRQPRRPWRRPVRGVLMGLFLWLAGSIGQGHAQTVGHTPLGATVLEAHFYGPTTEYRHAVLGDAVEWSGLALAGRFSDGTPMMIKIDLPSNHVFEDLFPRRVDLDLDGLTDAVMVVETDVTLGAALALYGAGGKIAQTPHIGRPNRWLAPVGAADLDGDGHVEVAYIDRPHLAKTLRVWRYRAGELREIVTLQALTNHRIGEDFISGGLRDCADGPELVLADAQFDKIVVVRLSRGNLVRTDTGVDATPAGFSAVLECA